MISPFDLLPFLNAKTWVADQLSFNDVKRRVLAEFELNNNQPLEIEGRSIGKSEALRIIEVFKEPDKLNQIIGLEEKPELKSFLSGKNMKYVLTKSNYGKEIPEFIQNQFQESFNSYVAKVYSNNRFKILMKILSFPMAERISVSVEKDHYDVLFR